jgi:hypothetical protein
MSSRRFGTPHFRKAAHAVLAFEAWLGSAAPAADRKSATARRQIQAWLRARPTPETTYSYDAQGRVTSSTDAPAPAAYTMNVDHSDIIAVTVGAAVFVFVLDSQELHFVGRKKAPKDALDGTGSAAGSSQ